MKTAVYVTDSPIMKEGHGGGVVSYHEHEALKRVCAVRNVYQNCGKLLLEDAYPNNPFMRDYYTASLILDPDDIDVAQFYGSSWTLTMKAFSKATKIVTVAAHNLETSIEEWKICGLTIPQHLTDPNLFQYLNRGLTHHADFIVCPSHSSAEYLCWRFDLCCHPEIIPHGTDLPKEWSSDREPFVVSNVGSAGPDKGLKYLIEAWQQKSFKGQLVFASSQLQIGGVSDIQSLGHVTEKQKSELYAKTSVYVAPSVTEGFGLTVLEAMSHGTPVIVTEGVGAKDCVTEGKDGFIVPIRNPKAIAETLLYFYQNPSEVKRMGNNARVKAEQHSWNKIEKRYEDLISACVAD